MRLLNRPRPMEPTAHTEAAPEPPKLKMPASNTTPHKVDVVENHLNAIQRDKGHDTTEVDAFALVLNRMRSALVICQDSFPEGFTDSSVAIIVAELGATWRHLQLTNIESEDGR